MSFSLNWVDDPDSEHPMLREFNRGFIANRLWWMILREIEEQAHDEGGTESLFRRFDATLDEEWRAHAKRDVERRHESEVQPVGPAERDALADRSADRVRRDKDPLRTRGMRRAETGELADEWIHVTSLP